MSKENIETGYIKNKKSGDIYLYIAPAIDCTNVRDGTSCIIYYPNTLGARIVARLIKFLFESPVFVRDKTEFFDKFERVDKVK